MQIYDPNKPIKTRSMKHVVSQRLLDRLDVLREVIAESAVWAEQKSDFKARVREVINIERELTRRYLVFIPLTDSQHLKVDLLAVPFVWPIDKKRKEWQTGNSTVCSSVG